MSTKYSRETYTRMHREPQRSEGIVSLFQMEVFQQTADGAVDMRVVAAAC